MSPEEPSSLLQELSQEAYPEIVRLIVKHLPAEPDAPPAALDALHRAAIAHAASMLPVNAEEAYIAAHCVIARARAEEALAEIPRYPLDTDRIDKLTRQFALMERTANSLRAQLLRVQSVRQKRDSVPKSCTEDEWTAHIAAKLMLIALGAQQKKAAEEKRAAPPPALQEADELPEFLAPPAFIASPELAEAQEPFALPAETALPEEQHCRRRLHCRSRNPPHKWSRSRQQSRSHCRNPPHWRSRILTTKCRSRSKTTTIIPRVISHWKPNTTPSTTRTARS